jgi:neutral ceramidase
VVFLQGFAGDVTQVDNLSKFGERPGEESARFVGGRVGAEAVKVLVGMARGTLAPLDARARLMRFQRRVPDPERLKQCLETVQKDPAAVGHTEWTFAKEIVLLDAVIAKAPRAEAEVQAIQIGPAVFLANPGETFCQFGLDLRAASPFAFTFPVELANGCVGYIPTEEALGEKGGGYETRLTSYSNLEPAAGRLMNEALLELARGMKPGKAPERPPAPPFDGPWTYGNVPPELK